MALDNDQTSFRYHHLVRRALHAELKARDWAREQALQMRAAEWFEGSGRTRHAVQHFLAARHADRALDLIQDRVVPAFLHDPAVPGALDLSTVDPSLLADAPDRLMGLATDLLLQGDPVRGGQYLDLLERAQASIPAGSRLAARLAAMRSFHYALVGQMKEAERAGNGRAGHSGTESA